MKKWFKNHWLYLLGLTLLVFITYANALNNAFLSDDLAEIVQNPNIGNLGIITTHPFGFIRLILYWLAFHIGGLNPIFFRLINIGFHLGCVFLIFTILNLIYSRKIAIIVASLFAVHPGIAEAVVWISGGTYPQYSFFFLLTFLLYMLSANKKKMYWLSVVAFACAFMSHPVMPLALFLIFPIYELSFGNFKKNWTKSIPYLILSITYVLINLSAIPERETTLHAVHYQERGIDNPLVLIPIAITSYFELIFWPKILTLYHSELVFSGIGFITRFLLTLLLFVTWGISFFKNKHIFFWLSLFLIALSPTLTPFRFNWIVAERYLYLPIVGILTLLSLGLVWLGKRLKGIDYGILIAILILLSSRTIFRNIDWQDEDHLWIATGQTSPSSPNTHNNLGDVYGRWGDKQRALAEFQKAIDLKPNYGDAYHNLANTYRELGQMDKALENYQNALKYNPNLWQSYQNIAAIYFEQKQYDKSLDYIQKAIQINPNNLHLRNNLGILYLIMGDKEKAKEIFNLVLSVDPSDQTAKQGLIEVNK